MKISIDQLAVRYDGKRVIDNLSLDIPTGTFFTLLGPSGCGKTTLLRAIAGFINIEEGRLLFGAADVTRVPAHKRNIGMVFQDYALFPDKTVFDNVAYGLRARSKPEAEIKKRVDEVLERVGLGALGKRHPAALSGGQRQRVALVRALVIAPDVLLMDEPLSNLDAKLRHQVRDTIVELQREAGITTIFVTHDQDEALAMSDRIGVMNGGRLEQIGVPAEIYRQPRTAFVADFIGAANLLKATVTEHLRVILDGHNISAHAPLALKPGPAQVIVRPEDIAVSGAGGPVSGGLPARIQRRQYLGSRTSYVMALKSGALVTVERTGDGHDAHATGDNVLLQLDPAKTLVLQA
jgi:iron(III) transport system ATP-binding protein